MPISSPPQDIVAAQMLLTLGDTEERRRYLNARATLKTLLDLGAVPVINENDTVATAEIRYGDNDRLGARVASMMGADMLVLLSDVDGLYTADPGARCRAPRIFPKSPASRREIEAMAGESVSGFGRGGMASKLIAARSPRRAGCDVIIAKGETPQSAGGDPRAARATPFSAPASRRPRRASAGSRAC